MMFVKELIRSWTEQLSKTASAAGGFKGGGGV